MTLTECGLTEDGLDALSTLRVSWLTISGMRLTDASVSSLIGMKTLSGIVLSDVQLTESGRETLHGAKGCMEIINDGDTFDAP